MESLWKATEKELLADKEEMKGQCNSDVCIIGGGITGISTRILFI